ncbi:unnamed protein product (macronuclear) [Paramecium tetraurelia]|uniref:Uncharacterized protein n=1 Tax=Paramecium tetraurelia TaxID=5888 RepID=A0D0Y1_PARTE|nr:uncharacterized protein GSPATT00012250001 [Paramecium tetraurelia]CAK76698.1 unnamed protein product [Paramecium tetraurelia]|eukprot:XP_001444095.1 hypothetical protein (macronuclear) [Paramecium tetraurelia strain d4-2]
MGTSQKFIHGMRIPNYQFSQTAQANDYRAILNQLNQLHQGKQLDKKFQFNNQSLICLNSKTYKQDNQYLQAFLNKLMMKIMLKKYLIEPPNYIQNSNINNIMNQINFLGRNPRRNYTKQFYQQYFNFVAAVSQAPDLNASEIGLAMFIYGQVSQYTKSKNKEVEQSLLLNFRQQIDHFKSNDLKHFSFGLILARIQRKDIFDMLEKQSLVTEMEFQDLIRVGTGIALFGKGSPEFWKLLEEQAIMNIPTTEPQNITTLFMLYKQFGHGTQEINKLFEQQFIQRYDQFSNLLKLQMFSSFAKIRYPSSALFKLFFRDIVGIIQSVNVTAVQMLILDCQKIFHQFPKQIQQFFIDFILKHYQKFNPAIKSKLYDSFQEQQLLTEELEVALLKKQ